MNCETCEQLFADALGGELSVEQRSAFDAHLAECPACRTAYAGDSAALCAMRSLPMPDSQTARAGHSAVIDELRVSRASRSRGTVRGRSFGSRPARLAASLLIAFTAGYVARWMTAPRGALPVSPVAVSVPADEVRAGSVQEALARSFEARRSGSDFARCLAVLFER